MSYTETFESYSLGQSLPFGQLVSNAAFANSVVTGNAGGSGSKSFSLDGGMIWADGFDYSHIYTAFAYKTDRATVPLKFGNHAGSDTYIFVELRINFDSTVSVFVAGSRVFTTAEPFNFREWNFYDAEITLSDLLGTLVIAVNHITINGVLIYSHTTTTAKATATLPTGTAIANQILYAGPALFDNLTVLTAPLDNPQDVRITKGFIEIAQLLDSAQVRITQGFAEVAQLPDQAQIRITQGFIELIIGRTVLGRGWQVKES